MKGIARAALSLALLIMAAGSPALSGPILLDDFDNAGAWEAGASEGVEAKASPVAGVSGGALRLDYDFVRGAGYAFVRRRLPLDLPDNFELRFKLRGAGRANDLQIKLTDAGGDNVWWHRKADYVPPGQWTDIHIKRRQIAFAWGPAADRDLRRVAAIELVVAAGSGGGKGWIAVDDLTLTPLPPDPAVPPPVVARGGADAANAVDGDPATAWTGRPGDSIDLDLGYRREFGGLVLHWAPRAYASAYVISLSDDGRLWRIARTVQGGDGGTDWIRLEESEARFVRLRPIAAPDGRFALTEIEVRPLAFGASLDAFVSAVAGAERRGLYPRGFIGEQNYWTLLAPPGGAGEASGLIDEDGAVEVARGGFSVEPFVVDDRGLATWADVAAAQNLREDSLPIARVEWRRRGWALAITAFAEPGGRLVMRYRLTNRGPREQALTLLLAIRPHQVNPPQQFLGLAGGASPISSLRWDGASLLVDGARRIVPAALPDAVKLAAFDAGPLPQARDRAGSAAIADPIGLGSGALVYSVRLAPGESRLFALSAPPRGAAAPFSLADAAIAEERTASAWRARLGMIDLHGPPAAEAIFAAVRSAHAQILMSRDGPALRPGTRAYARSWIRDGTMMSSALLRLGEERAAADFLGWYAPFQFPDGKIPCCVDARGADPVAENDSDGELIHLVAQLQLFTGDGARTRLFWPRVRAAADHIAALRRQTLVAENRLPGRREFYGLLPPSISHEGYSAKPMHSYWDDFWALAGLKEAAWLAGTIGRREDAVSLRAEADEFRGAILASLAAAQAAHRIAFIPGAADLGDFDPTSTTIALSVAGEQQSLPAAALAATFERYWQEFEARRDGTTWDAYTPYEWRNVGAFLRLGWRDRATALADFLMKDRRPLAWNQWAEVVGRVPRAPRFVGDMPHAWVASDFVDAVLDMLAYERERDHALVLAAGVPDQWLAGGGIAVARLRTPYGLLSYRLGLRHGRIVLRYALSGAAPPGGLVLAVKARGGPEERRLHGSSGIIEVAAR